MRADSHQHFVGVLPIASLVSFISSLALCRFELSSVCLRARRLVSLLLGLGGTHSLYISVVLWRASLAILLLRLSGVSVVGRGLICACCRGVPLAILYFASLPPLLVLFFSFRLVRLLVALASFGLFVPSWCSGLMSSAKAACSSPGCTLVRAANGRRSRLLEAKGIRMGEFDCLAYWGSIR